MLGTEMPELSGGLNIQILKTFSLWRFGRNTRKTSKLPYSSISNLTLYYYYV